LNILEEIGKLNAMFVDTPMDPSVILAFDQGEPNFEPGRYK